MPIAGLVPPTASTRPGFHQAGSLWPIAGLAPQPRSRGLVSTRPAVVRLVSPPPRVNPRPLQRSYPNGLEPFPMGTTSCAKPDPRRSPQKRYSTRARPRRFGPRTSSQAETIFILHNPSHLAPTHPASPRPRVHTIPGRPNHKLLPNIGRRCARFIARCGNLRPLHQKGK
jgi:hypothetical protein